jgi:hypothetical protein
MAWVTLAPAPVTGDGLLDAAGTYELFQKLNLVRCLDR